MFLIAIPEGCKRLAGRLRSSATDNPRNPTDAIEPPTPAGIAQHSILVNNHQRQRRDPYQPGPPAHVIRHNHTRAESPLYPILRPANLPFPLMVIIHY
jgi:hypothetical protein